MPDNIKDDNANESLDGDLELAKSDTDDVVGGLVRDTNLREDFTKTRGNSRKIAGDGRTTKL
jgi:hypothetical protein